MRGNEYLINDVMDWFGSDVKITDAPGEEATARVTVNLEAMRHWAMQYARHATVLSPQSLADLKEAAEKYKKVFIVC